MTKAKIIRRFAVLVKVISMCSLSDSTNVTMLLLHKIFYCYLGSFVLSQLLSTKHSVTIYVSALYKIPIFSIDVKSQPT